MTHPNAELLERAFSAFGRDAFVVARTLADDIVWRVPGTNAMSGEYVGRDATLQFLRQTLVLSGGTYRTELSNGALIHADAGHGMGEPALTVTLTEPALLGVLGTGRLDGLTYTGDAGLVPTLLGLLDTVDHQFPIVTP